MMQKRYIPFPFYHFAKLQKCVASWVTENQPGFQKFSFQSKNLCWETTFYQTLYSLKSKSIINFMWPEVEL